MCKDTPEIVPVRPQRAMQPLETTGPGDLEEQLPHEKAHPSALPWWFRAGCFCFTAVGADMAWHLDTVTCSCAAYPWRLEAWLLIIQGLLSYLHDAHFQGRSWWARIADRSCATFLTFCQPLKFAFCRMDSTQ